MAIIRHHARNNTTTATTLNIVERATATTISKVLEQASFVKGVWDVRDQTGQAAYDRVTAYLLAKSK
jgi:hypothetical protein